MSTADNQQERLRYIGWIVGFTDGEGCFSVSIIKNKTTLLGYQVFPEFVVTQGAKSLAALESIRDFFQCGKIYINRRNDNHKESLYRYCVRSISDLQNIIIPFFRENELHTAKKNDFSLFTEAVNYIAEGKHLSKEGLETIVMLKSRMNRKILRDYTSELVVSPTNKI